MLELGARRGRRRAVGGFTRLEREVMDADDVSGRLEGQRAGIVSRELARVVNVYMSGGGGSPARHADRAADRRRRPAHGVCGGRGDRRRVEYRRASTASTAPRRGARRARSAASRRARPGCRGEPAGRHAYGAFAQLDAAVNDATHGGRVFPVDGKYEFDDSWGFYRAAAYAGTTSHGHHATDIMAPFGTPIVAIESGRSTGSVGTGSAVGACGSRACRARTTTTRT